MDYEKQYGESQRRLDEREEEARQRELLLDLSQRQVAEQRAELDRLRCEKVCNVRVSVCLSVFMCLCKCTCLLTKLVSVFEQWAELGVYVYD